MHQLRSRRTQLQPPQPMLKLQCRLMLLRSSIQLRWQLCQPPPPWSLTRHRRLRQLQPQSPPPRSLLQRSQRRRRRRLAHAAELSCVAHAESQYEVMYSESGISSKRNHWLLKLPTTFCWIGDPCEGFCPFSFFLRSCCPRIG